MSRIQGIKSISKPDWSNRPDEDPLIVLINLITQISSLVGSDAIITTDVGQHQMWVAQYYPFMTTKDAADFRG